MFRKTTDTLVRSSLWLVILAALLAPVSEAQEPCADAVPIAPSGVVRDVGWATGLQCYTIDLSRPGTLLAAVTAANEPQPRLDVFECSGSGGAVPPVSVRDRWATSWLAEVSAGRYAVCVAAQDPGRRLAGFKLTSTFAERPFAKGDPDEDEPDPDPTQKSYPFAKGDPDEDEPDPDPTQGLLADEGLCRAVAADDHGDLFRCATPVAPGETVTAEIANAWGDDEDVFVLRLTAFATVHVTVTSTAGTRGTLHDRFGNRLLGAVSYEAAGLHLTKTLVPGLYFVRLSAPEGEGGVYHLRVSTP